jgi:hypothetical protein
VEDAKALSVGTQSGGSVRCLAVGNLVCAEAYRAQTLAEEELTAVVLVFVVWAMLLPGKDSAPPATMLLLPISTDFTGPKIYFSRVISRIALLQTCLRQSGTITIAAVCFCFRR